MGRVGRGGGAHRTFKLLHYKYMCKSTAELELIIKLGAMRVRNNMFFMLRTHNSYLY